MSQYFLEEIGNMFHVFLLSYRNTFKSLEELKKAVETLTWWLIFPEHFLFSQTFTQVSIKQLDYELKISIVCQVSRIEIEI